MLNFAVTQSVLQWVCFTVTVRVSGTRVDLTNVCFNNGSNGHFIAVLKSNDSPIKVYFKHGRRVYRGSYLASWVVSVARLHGIVKAVTVEREMVKWVSAINASLCASWFIQQHCGQWRYHLAVPRCFFSPSSSVTSRFISPSTPVCSTTLTHAQSQLRHSSTAFVFLPFLSKNKQELQCLYWGQEVSACILMWYRVIFFLRTACAFSARTQTIPGVPLYRPFCVVFFFSRD